MAGIKGMKHTRPRAKKHNDAIEASKIENLLADHYHGVTELSSTQLKAIELRYARLKPTLAAIEQTIVDPRDKADPSDILNRLNALLNEKPELWDQLVALRAAQQSHDIHTEQHVTH